MSEPINNHYLPVFYLKQWAGEDGRIVRYHRPHQRVVCHPISPSNTGYEPHLYALDGYPTEKRQAIETEFLGPMVDSPSATALQKLIYTPNGLDSNHRGAWTRFLISLLLRNPESLANIQEKGRQVLVQQLATQPEYYEAIKRPTDPSTLFEWIVQNEKHLLDNFGKHALPHLINSELLGQTIFGMHWCVVKFPGSAQSLLTSDRPVILTAPLKDQNCILALPVGPQSAFFACRENSILQEALGKNTPTGVVKALNVSLAAGAQKHVYGADRTHLAIVEKRFQKSL